MTTPLDYSVLRKYRHGGIVETKDKEMVHRLSGIGLMRMGFTTTNGHAQETTRPTSRGYTFLQSEDAVIKQQRRNEWCQKHPVMGFFVEWWRSCWE